MTIILRILQKILDIINELLFYDENNQHYERKNEFEIKRFF